MKIPNFMVIAILLFFSAVVYGQESVSITNPNYDAELAKKLGANDFGMKTFVFVTLKKGSAKITDPKIREDLQAGHMENITRLANEGKLVLAGPFLDDQDIRGFFIFDVRTIDEAKKLVETDPAVKAGLFDTELRLWFGSASLLEIPRIHKLITKKNL